MAKRNYRPRRVSVGGHTSTRPKRWSQTGTNIIRATRKRSKWVATVAKAVLPIVSAINTEAKYLDVSYSAILTITTLL